MLNWALLCQQLGSARALIAANYPVATVSFLGETPLLQAAAVGATDVVEAIVAKGVGVEPSDDWHDSPLRIASANGHLDAVDALLKHGADINGHGGWNRNTPLYHACLQGHYAVAKRLIERGANVNAASGRFFGRTYCAGAPLDSPLDAACSKNNVDLVKLLLANGAKVNYDLDRFSGVYRSEYVPPLTTAVLHNNVEVIQLLLSHGADVNHGGLDDVPLIVACARGYQESVNVLLDHNDIDINACSRRGTPLCVASAYGHRDIVEVLLARGANAAKFNRYDHEPGQSEPSPLFLASEHGHADVVRMLLEKGAVVSDANVETGLTPLYLACKNGHADVVRLLCQRGGKFGLFTRPPQGYVSAALTQSGVAGLLAGFGLMADPAAQLYRNLSSGPALLRLAINGGHADVVRALMEAGVSPNQALDHSGVTPLTLVSELGHGNAWPMAAALLDAGADLGVDSADVWMSLLQQAESHGNEAQEILLRSRMVAAVMRR